MPSSTDGAAFQAISDGTRRRILDALLATGPLRAGELAQRFPRISRPAVSKHLRVLRSSRLVLAERRGRELWYRVDPAPLAGVEQWVQKYAAFWEERLQALKDAAEAQSPRQ
ncbi:MAG: winged helix-turn-helix transcriptional regulator [Anaerolineales bacterium]|nr:MAG: winged helix-turn-helix transcriptional regulator [Anaerolineales bacterium]